MCCCRVKGGTLWYSAVCGYADTQHTRRTGTTYSGEARSGFVNLLHSPSFLVVFPDFSTFFGSLDFGTHTSSFVCWILRLHGFDTLLSSNYTCCEIRLSRDKAAESTLSQDVQGSPATRSEAELLSPSSFTSNINRGGGTSFPRYVTPAVKFSCSLGTMMMY